MSFKKKDDLNTSVEDLRQSVTDVQKSREMLRRARKNLETSQELYYHKKRKVKEEIDKTENVREELLNKREDCRLTMKSIRKKKEKIERYLMKRHAELKSQLDAQLGKSLRMLNEKSDLEISECMQYSRYLQDQITDFDILKRKIQKKVQSGDDYDLDFEAITNNVKKLEKLPQRMRGQPISTMFALSKELPLYNTFVSGKVESEASESSYM